MFRRSLLPSVCTCLLTGSLLICTAAAGQVEEDGFEVGLFDVDGADVKADGVGAADDDG